MLLFFIISFVKYISCFYFYNCVLFSTLGPMHVKDAIEMFFCIILLLVKVTSTFCGSGISQNKYCVQLKHLYCDVIEI